MKDLLTSASETEMTWSSEAVGACEDTSMSSLSKWAQKAINSPRSDVSPLLELHLVESDGMQILPLLLDICQRLQLHPEVSLCIRDGLLEIVPGLPLPVCIA